MKSYLVIAITCFLILPIQIFSQHIDFSYNFRSPLDIPLVLAGNFGELRSNHFHTGIDIKTNQKTGYNIYSVEEGFVSRVKVSPWGYGHVVYIDHPNGITSVYAHLERFEGKIRQLVKEQQRKQENFEIDYFPPKDSLLVERGQIIAKSGNTGGSTAPHLHFELRETITEELLNPLLFNFDIEDNVKPEIRRIKVYSVNEKGYRVPNKSKIFPINGTNGGYFLTGGKMTIDASYSSNKGGIGFAFDVIDKLNAANNVCGIYETFLIVDEDTIFSQNMERLSFLNNRQINTHKDYEEYHKNYRHFHKAFKTDNNTLPIYRKNKNNGILAIEPNKTYQIKYIVKDSYGNTSRLQFTLEITNGEKVEEQLLYSANKVLYPDSAFLSFDDHHYILFPPGILYEPTPLVLEFRKGQVVFGNDNVPLQETFKIMLPLTDQEYGDKYYIQRINSKGQKYSEKGTIHDGWITTRPKNFGTFSVQKDITPPEIKARNFQQGGIVKGNRLSWYINEEESGLVDYDIFIDGTWYLIEYEPKQRLFFFDPPKDLKGEKTVEIRAVDAVGNSGRESYTLTF